MGIYLNPGGKPFQKSLKSEIYVDKTGMLSILNHVMDTENRFICVSRARRFGKSMAANMIAAYYDRTAGMEEAFRGLKIGKDSVFEEHLGKYDVIQVNMQTFLSESENILDFLESLKKSLLWDLLEEYPDFCYFDSTKLMRTMSDIYRQTHRPFVIVIDEWDCIFREFRGKKEWQEKYLDFLRAWLKDQVYVGLAYMTGILPIKKYGTHSALNMFREFSMTDPGQLAEYVGFTEEEVRELCARYGMNFEECRRWYDGYHFKRVGSIYNPRSVVCSMESQEYDTYWNRTETFEALQMYIELNFDGLREAVISLMAGGRQKVNTNKFVNDMTTFHSKDDVLTLLVHLGYLAYDFSQKEVYIPNQEVMMEYVNSVEDKEHWDIVAKAIRASENLLEATLAMDSATVAKGIEKAHLETSHLQYNDENALAYTLSLAYYTARQKYLMVREFPTGKGFADILFLPRVNHSDLPALILELKWNKGADTAIRQIKEKNYPSSLEGYTGRMLLVGISYDRESRKHECLIEEWEKKQG